MKTKMTTNPSDERRISTFLSVKDANKWLGKSDSIVILNLRVEYHKTSHTPRTMIRRIVIDYVSYSNSVNITYGIVRTEYLNKRKTTDLTVHTDKWSRKNPDKELILCEKKTRMIRFSRNETAPPFLIRDTFFTLYKTEKEDYQLQQNQNINLKSKENLL